MILSVLQVKTRFRNIYSELFQLCPALEHPWLSVGRWRKGGGPLLVQVWPRNVTNLGFPPAQAFQHHGLSHRVTCDALAKAGPQRCLHSHQHTCLLIHTLPWRAHPASAWTRAVNRAGMRTLVAAHWLSLVTTLICTRVPCWSLLPSPLEDRLATLQGSAEPVLLLSVLFKSPRDLQ